MLVGEKEHHVALLACPAEGALGIARRAHCTAVAAHEGLQIGTGVHIGERHDGAIGELCRDLLPRIVDREDVGALGQVAACAQVGKDHALVWLGQDVRGLGHEVHTQKDHEIRLGRLGAPTGQQKRVAGDVGESDDFMLLVVVAKDDESVAEGRTGCGGTGDELCLGNRRLGQGNAACRCAGAHAVSVMVVARPCPAASR